MIFVVGGGGGGGPSASDAILTVTVPTGSNVTMTKGGTTLTPTMWVQAADATLDCALFVISPSLFDSQNAWTVTATLGEGSASQTVIIADNKQYDLVIFPPVYLVKNGTKIADFTGQNYTEITQQTGYVNFYVTQNVAATFTSTDPVDLTKYRQISITIPNNGRSYYRSGVEPSVIIGNPRPIFSDQDSSTTNTNFSLVKMLSSNTTITANTYTLDISNVSGAYYIGVAIGGSAEIRASLDISEWVVMQ
jgi:hypothetical protein